MVRKTTKVPVHVVLRAKTMAGKEKPRVRSATPAVTAAQKVNPRDKIIEALRRFHPMD